MRALRAAAETDGYVGFAIGRTIWGDPLERYLAGSIERGSAVEDIAAGYGRLVTAFRGE